MSIPVENHHIYDVVIIGAGPVGLAIANGLFKRGIDNLIVLEKAREFRKVGSGVDLLPNGLKSLKFINLEAYEKVKATGRTKSGNWNHVDLDGNILRSMSQNFDDWLTKYGEGRVSIAWYDLQTCLRNCLPSEKILVNHYCTNFSEEKNSDYLRIKTESNLNTEKNPYAYWRDYSIDEADKNNESFKKTFFSRVIIGADGINSVIRKILLNDSELESSYKKPEYSGFSGLFFTKSTPLNLEFSKEIKEKFLKNASLVTVRANIDINCSKPIEEPRMLLFEANEENTFGCAIQGAFKKELVLDKNGKDLIDAAKIALKNANFPDCLINIVESTPPEFIRKIMYYTHRAIISKDLLLPNTIDSLEKQLETQIKPSWFGNRVVLAGDAAHGMPPFSGQGTNQGFEDAAVLTELINEIKDRLLEKETIKSAFEKYDHLRRPALVKLQQAAFGKYSYYSDKQLEEYNQNMYGRSINTILQ